VSTLTGLISAGGGGVNSIQRGSVTVSNGSSANVTISAVDLSKSFLIFSTRTGVWAVLDGWAYNADVGGKLTSTTNIQFLSTSSVTGFVSSYGSATVYWEVVEYA